MSALESRAGRLGLGAAIVALAAVAFSANGLTFATFNASVANGNSTSGSTSLYSPPIVFAQSSGHAVDVNWNPAAPNNNGNGNGYAVSKTAVQASSSCPGSFSSYSTYVTSASPSGSAITVTESAVTAYTAASEGSWRCYVVQTGYNPAGGPPWLGVPSWNSQDTLQALPVQLGFVARSLTMVNGGTAGRLDPGDVITIVFNQPIVVPAGVTANTDTICTDNTLAVIVLASTTTSGGCNSALETADLGTLSGPAANTKSRFRATYVVTNNSDGTQTIKITVGARVAGVANPFVSGTFTFKPNANLTSQRGTPAAVICSTNALGGNCQPTAVSGL